MLSWGMLSIRESDTITPSHPVNTMTDRCKNNTLPQTSFVGGNKLKIHVDRKLNIYLQLTKSLILFTDCEF